MLLFNTQIVWFYEENPLLVKNEMGRKKASAKQVTHLLSWVC